MRQKIWLIRSLLLIALLFNASYAFAWDVVQTTIDGITYEATNSSGSTVIGINPSYESIVIPETYKYRVSWREYTSTVKWLAFESENLKDISLPNTIDIMSVTDLLQKNSVPNIETFEIREADLKIIKDNENNWICLSSDLKTLICGNSISETFNIPETVTTIGEKAFYGCSSLTSISIPNSVTSIGEYAFSDCTRLTSIVLGNSVESIGNNAFSNCIGLISLALPGSLTSVGTDAFEGCSGLKKSAYPNTISNPFKNGINIRYNPNGTITENNWIYGNNGTSIVFVPPTIEGDYEVPASVTSLEAYSFCDCPGLTSISLPETITSIGKNAFRNCTDLTSVTLPEYVTIINEYTFSGCSSLASLTIPDNTTTIGQYAFYNCSSLASLTIPDNATTIGHYAFYNCSSLESLTIPENVNSIGANAFEGLPSQVKIHSLSTTPPVMNDNSFAGLYDSAYLELKDSAVEKYLSTNWNLFKNIYREGSEEAIESFNDGVFNYRLIPASIKDAHNTAILISGNYSGDLTVPERFSYTDNQRYYVKGIGYKAFENSSVTSLSFNSRIDLDYIGDYAFNGCNKLSSISLPPTITSIGEYAFNSCTALEAIVIPDELTAINDYTFYNCTSLSSVTLPENLETIGKFVFSMENYDENLQIATLKIPASLKSIDNNAFLNRGIGKVVMSDLRAWCDIDFKNTDSNPSGWAYDGLWLNDEEIVDLVIPDGVEEIKPFAFQITNTGTEWELSHGTYKRQVFGRLKSVELPNSVKSIGEEAFCYNGFTEITIPSSVEYIGSNALGGSNLNCSYDGSGPNADVSSVPMNVIFEPGLTPIEIADEAFGSIFNINISGYRPYYVTLWNTPDTLILNRPLVSLPNGFSSSLKSLKLGDNLTEFPGCIINRFYNLTSVTIGNGIVDIPASAFRGNTALTSLTLGACVASIGENAFSGCTSLEDVVVPPSVETIGDSAFSGNTALRTIKMGHSVTSVGENAFNECPASNIYITAQKHPEAYINTFSIYSGKLWLQGKEALEDYYDAPVCWDRFYSDTINVPTKIILEGSRNLQGEEGDTFQLHASLPSDATLQHIFWRSTNPEIATVDHTGLVTLQASQSKTRALTADEEGAGECKIICETLYADGPVVEVTVNNLSTDIEDLFPTEESMEGEIDFTAPVEVYNLNGLCVATSIEHLPAGLYIVRQGKTVRKIAVN